MITYATRLMPKIVVLSRQADPLLVKSNQFKLNITLQPIQTYFNQFKPTQTNSNQFIPHQTNFDQFLTNSSYSN